MDLPPNTKLGLQQLHEHMDEVKDSVKRTRVKGKNASASRSKYGWKLTLPIFINRQFLKRIAKMRTNREILNILKSNPSQWWTQRDITARISDARFHPKHTTALNELVAAGIVEEQLVNEVIWKLASHQS